MIFLVTVPKVQSVGALHEVATALQTIPGAESVRIEAMLESPFVEASKEWLAACDGRLDSVHLGVSDYLSELDVAPEFHGVNHPACNAAILALQRTFVPSGVRVVHGTTPTIPLGSGPERAHAEKLHADNVVHALRLGVHQSWDLHPHQVVVRTMVLLAHAMVHAERYAERLRAFLHSGPTRVGNDFDDAASVRSLLRFFARGIALAAFDKEDLQRLGLGTDVLSSELVGPLFL